MNRASENHIDGLLDKMKERSCDGREYPSTEQFKAEFFRRVERERKRILPRIFRYTAVAAAFLVFCTAGLVGLEYSSREKGSAAPGYPAGKEENAPALLPPSPVSPPAPCAKPAAPSVRRKNREMMVCGNISFDRSLGSMGCFAPPAADFCRPRPAAAYDTEEYKHVSETPFMRTDVAPLSTFGADADTAGYTNVRRFLLQVDRLPPKDAVRTEEFLNYFRYDYRKPAGKDDFAVTFESMDAPWAPERKLLLVGVQAREEDMAVLPPSNFVFLIDNSGSMSEVFPMVVEAMETLAGKLRPADRISVVTYGGGVSVIADGVSGAEKEKIRGQLRSLAVGGYTPGGAGIQEAYKLAHKHFIAGGNNRIVLITDGDFNVGVSSESELVAMVEKERRSAIYLSAFGVGYGNYRDNKLKMLANKGNGNYAYLDSIREARRVMTHEMTGRMFTLARDVKFQIEFNPARVAAYRLVGYELRRMEARDFRDDEKDSGEVGIGHQVTAVYELVMADAPAEVKERYLGKVDKLKYQQEKPLVPSGDILTFKLRCQQPEGNAPGRETACEVRELPQATDNIRWAAAVTEFCLLLRDSRYKGNADFRSLRRRARSALGADEDGKRAEFLTLVTAAEALKK